MQWRAWSIVVIALIVAKPIGAQEIKAISLTDQAPNTWVKRSPLKDAPLSPMLGYEGSFGYDPKAKLVIRWAGHNQGGGGEQNAETWTFDPVTAKWTLKEPNTSPPGACCNAQNVFDPVGGRFLRFPAFSGSHGWHWFRENYLNNSSVWSYDLSKNTWRDMRPVPTPRPAPLRCASWDSDRQVVVIFGGEGSNEGTIVYDPYDNSWKRMLPKKEPVGRSAGNMAYHKSMKKHFLFGTQFSDDPYTWAYDLARNEWTDLKPVVQPPTKENDAVLAYDEVSDVIVASIRAPGGDGADGWHYETWVYEHVKNTWKKMDPKVEPPGGGQRRRIMVAIPDQNLILMENYVNPPQKVPGVDREQQIWTYRYNVPKGKTLQEPAKVVRSGPRLVEDVIASVISEKRVALSWPAAKEPDVLGYYVERAPVEVFSEDQIIRLRTDTPPLEQPSVGALKAIGKFEKLIREPIKTTRFLDEGIDLAKPVAVKNEVYRHRFTSKQIHDEGKPYRFGVYAYRVRAVNKLGVESGGGPYALTIPSAPQWVFSSKEEGAKCQLFWQRNVEVGIAGYRIYRMESPRINGAGQKVTRVTPEPIRDAHYFDPNAGKQTCRYWIVAVDALGQEGYPSAPTWHERQFKKVYSQFTGPWHQ
jgi:hypothetical protein